jgi:hypothetical protein
MNLLPLSEPRCIGHTHGSSQLQSAQPCSCGCGRKEGGVAYEAVICDGKRAHVPEAHWDFPPECIKCERRVK